MKAEALQGEAVVLEVGGAVAGGVGVEAAEEEQSGLRGEPRDPGGGDADGGGDCCIAHSLVAPVSPWAGGRLLPARNDPRQARIRIAAFSAA